MVQIITCYCDGEVEPRFSMFILGKASVGARVILVNRADL